MFVSISNFLVRVSRSADDRELARAAKRRERNESSCKYFMCCFSWPRVAFKTISEKDAGFWGQSGAQKQGYIAWQLQKVARVAVNYRLGYHICRNR